MIITSDGIRRRLGKSIIIHPFQEKLIKGVGYNLTVSKFAWSVNRKVQIQLDNNNNINIPPSETMLIWTEETVWISSSIAGTFHSRVGLVSIGLSPISTTLDPEWIGPLLIAVTNFTKNIIAVKASDASDVGDTLVTLIFHTAEKTKRLDSKEPGRMDILDGYPKSPEAKAWRAEDHRIKINSLKEIIRKEKTYEGIETARIKISNIRKFIIGWMPFIILAVFLYIYKTHLNSKDIGWVIGTLITTLGIGINWIRTK